MDTARVVHRQVAIAHPVKTAFGIMRQRHAVFLVIRDEAGREGVGESWVNFPLWAARERVAALEEGFVPYLAANPAVADIAEYVARMYRAFLGPARQSGTEGPLLSAVCAVELALWDLAAQAAGVPLARLLFEAPHERVRVYASGINSPLQWDRIDEHLACGVRLFKLKLGFGDEEDRRNLDALRTHLDGKAELAVDVNRGWSFDQALAWLDILAAHNVRWMEEPLRWEDGPELAALAERSPVPLAGGENIRMPPGCDVDVVARGPFCVLQPDITKYTPLHVALRLLAAGCATEKWVVPHFLGSAPGQAASIHLAAGCPDGLVEWDMNENALRTDLFGEPFTIVDGAVDLPDAPGLGWLENSSG
ncbi:MAG: mandelate racemase/muconate lactonizing enzyme family protein [Kiritimatiellae bacterium]|nr:mandelate racemase/muconate lactonizing enzyme family protein [Kiritimatiellia bacterium]